MQVPNDEEFSRIHELIDEFDQLPESRVRGAIDQLRNDGEADIVVSFVGHNYRLPALPEFEFKSGDRIADRYEIKEKIGAGGMGVVYRAEQDRTKRDVALKLIHPRLQTRALRERFEEEIVTLGKLEHQGIVHLFDAGKHDGSVFFTMQLVDGEPLNCHLRGTELTRHQKLDIIIRLCDAVHYAHESGIIHRDLKPGNILIDRATGKPVILDFGLATLAGNLLSGSDGEQKISGLSGTPNFMSPEQFLGTAGEFGAGQSIDIYALGVIAFEILAGRSPYDFPNDASWTQKRRVVLESPPRQLENEPELDEAIRKALRKNPADRYFAVSGLSKSISDIQKRLAAPEDVAPPAWQPSEGATIPSTDWVLEKKIGEGGIGQVWLAEHPELNEKRVFKFCEDEEKLRSLKREASLFYLLKEKVGQHPNIVRLHDVSLDVAPYYIAMDHIAGGDLQSWSESQGGIGNIPVETRIDIIAQAATTLQAAHDAGILHRDIKPSNLLIDTTGDRIKVYIADFGIGQLLAEDNLANTRLGFTRTIDGETTTGAGSHRYMAPEILSGQAATVRSDIYSLGVVLYQSLIEDFNKPVTVDWYENIDDPLLEDDLKNCFAGDPETRFPSAQQLAENLRTLEGDRRRLDELRRKETRVLERRAYRRGMVRAGAIAMSVIAALAWLSWFSYNKSVESWKGESRLRISEIRILRESPVPERRRKILARIEQANRRYPAEDVLDFRNELLAALSLPAPYGLQASTFGGISSGAEIFRSGNQIAWHEGDHVHIATITPGGLVQAPPRVTGPNVSNIALNPTDGSMATLSAGGELRVSVDPTEFQLISSNCDPRGLAIHPSGLLAAAGSGGQVNIFRRDAKAWDLEKTIGQRPPQLTPYSQATTQPVVPIISSAEFLAFSPDARLLAVGGEASLYIQIWDTAGWHLIARCRQASYPTHISWDPILRNRLWSASADGSVYGWDKFSSGTVTPSPPPTVLRTAGISSSPAVHFDTSPDGTFLVTTAADESITFLATDTLTLEESGRPNSGRLSGYLSSGELWQVTPDGDLVIRAAPVQFAQSWRGGTGAFLRLARSPDGTLIAGSCGAEVIITDAATMAAPVRLPASSRVIGVTFSSTKSQLIGSGIKGVYAWSWEALGAAAVFGQFKTGKTDAMGGEVISIGEDGGDWIALSDAEDLPVSFDTLSPNKSRLWEILGTEPVTALVSAPGLPWFAASRRTNTPTSLYFPSTNRTVVLPALPSGVNALACSRDGALLAQRTAGQIVVTNTNTTLPLATFSLETPAPDPRTTPIPCTPVAMTDDGSLIAATGPDSHVVIFAIGHEGAVAKLPLPLNSPATSLIFTSSDALIAGTVDGRLWRWELPEMRRELRRFKLDWKPGQSPAPPPVTLLPAYRED